MSSNAELLRKADLALSDLSGGTNGGLLNDEQSNKFIRKLIAEPTLLRQIRTVTMRSPQRQLNKIQFASRIMRKAVQGVALVASGGDEDLGTGDRSKPTTEQILLATDEYIAEVRIPYDVMEDNIERGNLGNDSDGGAGTPMGGGLRDTIVTLIAERAALDLEELAIQGDTGSADKYLKTKDAFLTIVDDDGNEVDWNSATVTKEMFRDAMKTMPDQYLRNLTAMRHFLSIDQEIEYRDTLSNRPTAVGDALIDGTRPVNAYGVPVEGVSLMPEAKGLFTHPHNLIMGIQRDVMLEFDKNISERVYIIVLTTRLDFKVEEPDAAVVYLNVGTP